MDAKELEKRFTYHIEVCYKRDNLITVTQAKEIQFSEESKSHEGKS